jgi:hypothetical protein
MEMGTKRPQVHRRGRITHSDSFTAIRGIRVKPCPLSHQLRLNPAKFGQKNLKTTPRLNQLKVNQSQLSLLKVNQGKGLPSQLSPWPSLPASVLIRVHPWLTKTPNSLHRNQLPALADPCNRGYTPRLWTRDSGLRTNSHIIPSRYVDFILATPFGPHYARFNDLHR